MIKILNAVSGAVDPTRRRTLQLQNWRIVVQNPGIRSPISPSPVCVVAQHVTDGPLALEKKRHSASHGPGVTPRSGCWVQWFLSPSRTGITSILDGPRRLELPKPLAGCRYEGGFERGQQEAEGWHRVVEMEPRISALNAQHLWSPCPVAEARADSFGCPDGGGSRLTVRIVYAVCSSLLRAAAKGRNGL